MAKRASNKPAAKAAATPLSEIVVTDPAGDAYAEGDIPPEIVVGSERIGSEDSAPPAGLELPPVAAKPALEDHPAIELAQSFVTPHGRPEAVHGNYYTPPPPDLRKPAKV